jgi:L-lactate utilization protein LutB
VKRSRLNRQSAPVRRRVALNRQSAKAGAYAAAAAAAAAAERVSLELAAFLDELLDQWEEACTKEGEDVYVSQPWEDDVFELIDSLKEAK